MRNGHYPLPPLRPELQAAHDEMDAKGDYFAYAVCRTHDGQAWEVTTRREPPADEAAYRALWEAQDFSR